MEKYWRLQGVKIAIFLDDGLAQSIENDYRVCITLTSRTREDSSTVGFVAMLRNLSGSLFNAQCIVWLSFCWNFLNGTISITERRLHKIIDHIQNITGNCYVLSARQLACFTGKIISTRPVAGNVSRIMTMSIALLPSQTMIHCSS